MGLAMIPNDNAHLEIPSLGQLFGNEGRSYLPSAKVSVALPCIKERIRIWTDDADLGLFHVRVPKLPVAARIRSIGTLDACWLDALEEILGICFAGL